MIHREYFPLNFSDKMLQVDSTESIPKNQFFFKSKTNRFGYEREKEESATKDKHVHGGPMMELNLSMTQTRPFSVESKSHISNLDEVMKNYQDVEPTQQVPFGSNSPRFMFKKVFYGEDLKLTPGPGYYTKQTE